MWTLIINIDLVRLGAWFLCFNTGLVGMFISAVITVKIEKYLNSKAGKVISFITFFALFFGYITLACLCVRQMGVSL